MDEEEIFAFFADWKSEARQSYTHVGRSRAASGSLTQIPNVPTLRSF